MSRVDNYTVYSTLLEARTTLAENDMRSQYKLRRRHIKEVFLCQLTSYKVQQKDLAQQQQEQAVRLQHQQQVAQLLQSQYLI